MRPASDAQTAETPMACTMRPPPMGTVRCGIYRIGIGVLAAETPVLLRPLNDPCGTSERLGVLERRMDRARVMLLDAAPRG
jgi:hypothetical protein